MNLKNIFLAVLVLVITIFSVTTASLAAGADNQDVWTAKVQLSGDIIVESEETDVVAVGDIAYISFKYISRFTDAKLIWISESSELFMVCGRTASSFVMGSTNAFIGTQEVELKYPPLNVEGRTYISAADCSVFDLTVSVDEANRLVDMKKNITRELCDVVWSKENVRDVVYIHTSSSNVPYESFLLSSPDRLVIDLMDTKMPVNPVEVLGIESDIVSGVRVAHNRFGVVRVVVDMKMSAGHVISYDEESGILKVMFNIPVSQISVLNDGTMDSLFMSIRGMQTWPEPYSPAAGMCCFDIEDATLTEGSLDIPVEGDVLEWVRAVQYTPSMVRVAAKVKDGYSAVVTPMGDDLWGVRVDFVLKLEGPFLEYVDNNVKVKFTSSVPLEFNVFNLVEPERVVIDVKNVYMGAAQYIEADEESALKSLRTAQFTANDGRIVLDVKQGYGFTYEVDETNTSITLMIAASVLDGKVIMIDPGHGGSDCGSNYKEIYEKDITLDIGLILRDMLTEAGAVVYMTRDDDVHVSLAERSDLANKIVPDVLLSVHCNSFTTEIPSGTETYYHNLEAFSKTLATKIQNSMVGMTGMKSRGIKVNDYYVLRETFVPAALAEVAFISNPSDREKLCDPDFRYTVAESLFNALANYFQSSEYETWTKLKYSALGIAPFAKPGQGTDSLTWLYEIIEENNLKPSSLKYVLPDDVFEQINTNSR